MVNTEVATTLLMEKWVDAQGLPIKKKVANYISSANSTSVKIVGMTSMTLLLVPTLELDVSNVTIFFGQL